VGLRWLAPLLALALMIALPTVARGEGRIASAIGVKHVGGEKLYVDVVVAVPRGQSARQATDRALSHQGAKRRKKPPWAGGPGGGGGGDGGGGEQYFYTGLVWSQQVTQSYNSADEPLDAKGALLNTHATWSNVDGSTFSITDGADTTRCPSLVKQCPGRQVNDSDNDVAWLRLDGQTLGVTWYTTSDPEADMALNTRFAWKSTCDGSGTGYDVETVMLHENGHVAGLDHAQTTDSVMYPSYQSPRCTLTDYDRASLANLY
jgi:hypothetical protein